MNLAQKKSTGTHFAKYLWIKKFCLDNTWYVIAQCTYVYIGCIQTAFTAAERNNKDDCMIITMLRLYDSKGWKVFTNKSQLYVLGYNPDKNRRNANINFVGKVWPTLRKIKETKMLTKRREKLVRNIFKSQKLVSK